MNARTNDSLSKQNVTRRVSFGAVLAVLQGTVFAVVTSLAATAHAEDASTLLMKMNKAFAIENYDGMFTYFTGDDLASLRVVHKVVDGVQKERLVHLNGAPREIIRLGEEVVCIVQPGDDIAVLEDSIPAGPFARAFVREFERVSDSYVVTTAGEGRVAGRSATRVAVTPRDAYRYGYRLWLDQETALLLRSDLVSAEGERLEVFQFSQITIGDGVSDQALEFDEPQGSMVSHLTLRSPEMTTIANPTSEVDWHIDWLPPGFKMAMADVRQKPRGESNNIMMYSDGLASFSVFLEPMPERGAASMVSMSGGTVAITRGVEANNGYYLATLVGEIPEATGIRIIESISAI